MGGLARRMPLTMIAFAISAAALAGLPVTAALPPKDAVLAAAWQANSALFVVALVASLLTAWYSARIFGLVFLGKASEPARQADEAKQGLLLPLLVIAALIPIGLLSDAALLGHPLEHLLGVPLPEVPIVTILALATAVGGVVMGLGARLRWPASVSWPVLNRVTPFVAGEFGLKVLYQEVTRLGFRVVAWLGAFDRQVFDTLLGGIVAGVLAFIRGCGSIDRRVSDAFARMLADGTLAVVRASGRFAVPQLVNAVRELGRGHLDLGPRGRDEKTGRFENYLR